MTRVFGNTHRVQERRQSYESRRWIFVVTAAFLLLSFSAVGMLLGRVVIEKIAKSDFYLQTDEMTHLVQQKVRSGFMVLYGARALFDASDEVTAEEWHEFVDSQDLFEKIPGLMAIQYIVRTEPTDKDSSRGPSYVITYVEPEEMNKSLLGFDVGTEPVRRLALEQASLENEIVVTPPVALLQKPSGPRNGIVMVLPVYHKEMKGVGTLHQGRKIRGFVALVIKTENFFENMLEYKRTHPGIDFKIFDEKLWLEQNNMIFSDGGKVGSLERDFKPRFVRVVDYAIGGRVWKIYYSAIHFKIHTLLEMAPVIAGFLFFLIGLFSAWIYYLQRTAREKARLVAQKITQELGHQTMALNAFAIVSETDAQGKITYVNDQFCEISKYPRRELLGQNHRIINSGFHPKSFFVEMWRTISAGQVWRGEVKNRAKDGTLYWVDTTIVPLLGDQGRPERYLSIRTVISERKALEEKLAAAAAQSRLLHHAAGFAVRDLTFDQALQETVEMLCKAIHCPVGHVYKYNPQTRELISSPVWYLAEDKKMLEFKKETELLSDFPKQGMAGRIAASKKVCWINNVQREDQFPRKVVYEASGLKAAFGFPILSRDQEILAVLEFFMKEELRPDSFILNLFESLGNQLSAVFEKKKTMDTVLSSKIQLQAVFDSATEVSIIATETSGVIKVFNKGAEKMLGWTADEMIGKRTPEVIHLGEEVVERGKEISQDLGKTVQGFDVFVENARQGRAELREWTYVRKDGTRLRVNLVVTSVRDPQGEITGFLGIATDITKIKEAEKSLQAAVRKAEEASHAKSDFLATMSHEIRTPMNSILGMAELLSDTKLNSEQKDYLERLSRGGETLLAIINDILDLSKIEAGSMEIERIEFALRDQLEKTVDLFSHKAHQKGLEVNLVVESSLPDKIISDPTRLRQIMMNLLSNAIKFTHQGEISIRVFQDQPSFQIEEERMPVHFVVRDTGVGISRNHLEKLFVPFSQGDSSMTRQFGGTGLGLNICKRLVEMMNGKIWVESESGKGSFFHFVLPLMLSEHQDAETPTHALELAGKQILLVEDHPTTLEILKTYLQSWGATVESMADGSLAFDTLKNTGTQRFDLVILDNRMPVLGGMDVARKLRVHHVPSIPMMLMLNADHRNHDRELARELGFTGILVKPVKKNELYSELMKLLGKERQRSIEDRGPIRKMADTEGETRRVLIVEDSDDNQKFLTAYLSKGPYQIEFAENGKVACELTARQAYDLIIMDMQMPEMDGYTATGLIRSREVLSPSKSHVPIIALTAHALKDDAKKCLDAGCDYYLSKPIKKGVLLETLRSAFLKKAA